MAVRKGGAERLTPRESVADSEIEVLWMSAPCGWCMTGHCSDCKSEFYWEKKLYMCGCKDCSCGGHVPSIEVKSDVEETTED